MGHPQAIKLRWETKEQTSLSTGLLRKKDKKKKKRTTHQPGRTWPYVYMFHMFSMCQLLKSQLQMLDAEKPKIHKQL